MGRYIEAMLQDSTFGHPGTGSAPSLEPRGLRRKIPPKILPSQLMRMRPSGIMRLKEEQAYLTLLLPRPSMIACSQHALESDESISVKVGLCRVSIASDH